MTIAYIDVRLSSDDTDQSNNIFYRVCAKNRGCPEATDSLAGDIMVDLSGTNSINSYQWIEEESLTSSSTRPANPVVDDFFQNLESIGQGNATEGYLPTVALDSGRVTFEVGQTYTIVLRFVIGKRSPPASVIHQDDFIVTFKRVVTKSGAGSCHWLFWERGYEKIPNSV